MREIVDKLQQMGMRVCAVYLIDSQVHSSARALAAVINAQHAPQFAVDASKFLSACMQCLSTMIMLELPHVSVLSKMDLVTRNKRHMRKFFDCNSDQLLQALRTPEHVRCLLIPIWF
jgi:predicted SPOUT superfamily RNA methylase MTH1